MNFEPTAGTGFFTAGSLSQDYFRDIINLMWAWDGPNSDLALEFPGFDSPQVHHH